MKVSAIPAFANRPRRRLPQTRYAALAACGALLFAARPVLAQTAYTDSGATSQFSTSITPAITGSTSYLAGDSLTFNNGSDSTQSDNLATALNFNSLVFNNSGALVLNQGTGTNITLGNTSGGVGPTVTLNNPGSVNNNLNLALANNTSFLGSGFVIFGGVVSGAGSLNQNGSGRVILVNATNTYAGGTNINGGSVALGNDFDGSENAAGLGSGAVNITNGGTLRLGGTGGNTTVTYNIANAITLNNGTVFGVDGAQHLGGTLTIGAGGGTLQATYGGRDITVDGRLTGSGTLNFAQAQYNGGVVLTNNTNNFSGTANINGNTTLNVSNALANAAVVTTNQNNGNGRLFFGPGVTTAVFGSLAGSGDFSLNNADNNGVTLTVGGDNTSTAFSGYLSGSGGITKTGTGTLSLTRDFGGSQFTGNVVVNGGTLVVARAGNDSGTASVLGRSIAGRTVTVNAGSALTGTINNWFGGGSTPDANLPTVIVNAGTVSGQNYTTIGALNLNNGATVTQSTNNSGNYQGFALRGDVTVTGATPSTISATGTSGYHLGPNTTFNVAANSALNVSSPLINQSGDFNNGAGALTKTGGGTMLLTAASSYTGVTTVSGGTLRVDSAGSTTARLAGTSGIVLNTGGILLLANTSGVASSDRINDAATVTLAGGTLNLGGRSEGAAGSTGIGALTLTATSTLDFGPAGQGNVIQFGALAARTGGTFQVIDWEGSAGNANGTDRLLFAGSPTDFTSQFTQSQVSFNGTQGYGITGGQGGFYEVYGIAAVPEPGTWFAGVLTLGILAYSRRRSLPRTGV